MIGIVHVGLGPLGRRVVRYALERKGLTLVGAVDVDPAMVGKDVGTFCGARRLGIAVAPDVQSVLGRKKADVAVLTTVSDLKRIESQIAELARAGLNVVSTCEELSYPWRTAPRIAKRIDATCRRCGVTCLGTGVNPGFLMDYLPAVMSGVCRNVRKVIVERVQDASVRRIPFQQKIGAGLTAAAFRRKKAEGALRHVGLPESVHMIAAAVGWRLTKVTESLRAVKARKRTTTGYMPIAPGMARGVEQFGRGFVGKREVIKLHFRAAVGEPESFDRIRILGEPNIESTIEGGVNGDIATCAVALNAIPRVLAAEPGLKTMLDLAPPVCAT